MAASLNPRPRGWGGFDGRCTVSLAAIRPGAAQAGADGQDDGGARGRSPRGGEDGRSIRTGAGELPCDSEGTCRDWFLEGESEQADFCPNEEFFAALKREK